MDGRGDETEAWPSTGGGKQQRRAGGERTSLLHDLVIRLLATHPLRGGAPLLRLAETPPTFVG